VVSALLPARDADDLDDDLGDDHDYYYDGDGDLDQGPKPDDAWSIPSGATGADPRLRR
jgi:hypothetical protein